MVGFTETNGRICSTGRRSLSANRQQRISQSDPRIRNRTRRVSTKLRYVMTQIRHGRDIHEKDSQMSNRFSENIIEELTVHSPLQQLLVL